MARTGTTGMALLLALAMLAASALACSRHNECATGNYCDRTGNCFNCTDFCMTLRDAIDGCCPCNSSCVSPTSAPTDTVSKSVYQFSFTNDFAMVDDRTLFINQLVSFLQARVADAALSVLDVYPGSSSSTNVVLETNPAAIDRLRNFVYESSTSLGFTYVNAVGNNVQTSTVPGSVVLVVTPNSEAINNNDSSSSILVPVVVVIAVVIVLLVGGAIFVMYRAKRLQSEITAARMAGYDETDDINEFEEDAINGGETGAQQQEDNQDDGDEDDAYYQVAATSEDRV